MRHLRHFCFMFYPTYSLEAVAGMASKSKGYFTSALLVPLAQRAPHLVLPHAQTIAAALAGMPLVDPSLEPSRNLRLSVSRTRVLATLGERCAKNAWPVLTKRLQMILRHCLKGKMQVWTSEDVGECCEGLFAMAGAPEADVAGTILLVVKWVLALFELDSLNMLDERSVACSSLRLLFRVSQHAADLEHGLAARCFYQLEALVRRAVRELTNFTVRRSPTTVLDISPLIAAVTHFSLAGAAPSHAAEINSATVAPGPTQTTGVVADDVVLLMKSLMRLRHELTSDANAYWVARAAHEHLRMRFFAPAEVGAALQAKLVYSRDSEGDVFAQGPYASARLANATAQEAYIAADGGEARVSDHDSDSDSWVNRTFDEDKWTSDSASETDAADDYADDYDDYDDDCTSC